ncbi:MAG: hypothetical protein ABF532_09040 [Bifidobacterium sp.]
MAETTRRVRFRDIKPYDVPNSLEELNGPYDGVVKLRHSVLWVGDGNVDVSTIDGTCMAYQALLAEGQVSDQEAGLNARKLVEVWPELSLDRRVRDLWESRFPELRVRS